jgi:ABC-2 type transport system permease protein
MRSVFTMLQKEWLENPLVSRVPFFMFVCGTLLFISIMSNSNLSHNFFFQMNLGEDSSSIHKEIGDELSTLIAGGAGLLSILLGTQYFPRTLRKERSEGSIMFWRSMPVSDIRTHLVKLAFGLLVIPLVCSALVVIADLMLWLLNISTDHQLGFLYRHASLGYVLLHWGEFLLRMGLAAILLLPLALIIMAISQKVTSPLVILFLAIYALRWMPIVMFGYDGVDQFFSEIFYLPFHAIIAPNPVQAMQEAGWSNIASYTVIGVLAWITNLKFSRTIQ